jgi:hypothetical protein
MSQYRVEELDLSTRIEIGLKMMMNSTERGWGWVTEMAAKYGVSRQTFYDLRDEAQAALERALKPNKPGPKPVAQELEVNREYINWATTVLAMQKGSTRDIQLGLALLFDVKRSVGFISQTLNEVGKKAADYNTRVYPAYPVQGEVDEVFQKMMPCLTVVDGQSFMVLNLSAEANRSGETWGKTFQRLAAQGVVFEDVVSDNASGIRAGLKETGLDTIWRLDVFHSVYEGHKISQKLENAAYNAMRHAERAQIYATEQAGEKRRKGRRRKAVGPVSEAEQQQALAIERFDLWTWLFSEVRLALEPVHGYRFNDSITAREVLEVASDLLLVLDHPDVTAFATHLVKNLDSLLAPLRWREQMVADWQPTLQPEDEALILLVLRSPDLKIDDLPGHLQPAALVYENALLQLHRASSHAESFHSWLRPYFDIHRTLPDWLLSLATLFWNHHTFQRGKRAGHSPVELAGIDDALSLHAVLRQVCQMAFDTTTVPMAARRLICQVNSSRK